MSSREALIFMSNNNIRGQYRIERTLLGQGSYGSVKLAYRISDNQKCAVKIMQKHRVSSDLLKSEIAIMKQADHPNIVRIFEAFEDSRFFYIVMELCEGGELFDRIISTSHFTESLAAQLFSQMLSAVVYLHYMNVVHRDIKPENFMFSSSAEDSVLKLIDFGVAKAVDSGESLSTRIGSPYYISPQTLRGNYTEKCDVWSLGVILYMLLSGSPPFVAESDAEIMKLIETSEVVYDPRIWDSISVEARDLIDRMLDKDEETRISASDALCHPWLELNDHRTSSPIKLSVSKIREYQKSKRFRRAVLSYMASQCSTGEILELINLFQSIDTEHMGNLSIEEMRNAMRSSEIAPGIEESLSTIDSNGDGVIDLNEFLAVMLDKRVYENEEKLWHAFKRFDMDSDGKISAQELREVIGRESEGENSLLWSEMIREADFDGDGEVNFEDFIKMMGHVSLEERRSIRSSISPFISN